MSELELYIKKATLIANVIAKDSQKILKQGYKNLKKEGDKKWNLVNT